MNKVRSIAISLFIYSLFAIVVFIVHGNEPSLSVDHIAYFNLVHGLRVQHPDGAYWQSFSALESYAILLAYISDFVGDLIYALKWILAAITVSYLLSFELLLSLFTCRKWQRILFSLLSAMFVSFGASFWGFTDFSASLNRSIVVPFMVLSLWFFLKYFERGWKYLVYPFLVAVSTFHLSAYYLIGVLLLFEGLDFIVLRQWKVDKRIPYWLAGIAAACGVRTLLSSALGATNYVATTVGHAIAFSKSANLAGFLNYQQAWEVELYAFPWRNMPLPLTTVAMILLSYGIILLLALYGGWITYRRGWKRLDKIMVVFSAAVFCGAYGLQTLLWLWRTVSHVYPMNFEEMRAINLIMIPSIYFVFRLTELLTKPTEKTVQRYLITGIMTCLVVLQPIVVLHLTPDSFRLKLLEQCVERGLIKSEDSLRLTYARQLLGLDYETNRFYYSSRGVVDWLANHVQPGSKVLTDRNDIVVYGIQSVGNFVGVLGRNISSIEQASWRKSVPEVHSAIGSANIAEVVIVAKQYDAEYAVVPWPEKDAVYEDKFYSIIKIGDKGER